MPNAVDTVVHQPLPATFPVETSTRALMSTVKFFFVPLYNSDVEFRGLMESTDNKNAKTGNRHFDRYEAVQLLIERARMAQDTVLPQANPGEIYQCMTVIMRKAGFGYRARLHEQRRLAMQARQHTLEVAAEATADAEG